jgi:toxin ParE1/3/4
VDPVCDERSGGHLRLSRSRQPARRHPIDDRIETQVELLIDTPEIGRRGRIEGTRELVIPRTPYIAAYRIERETVTILRVLHGAQEWPEEMEPGGDTEKDSAT